MSQSTTEAKPADPVNALSIAVATRDALEEILHAMADSPGELISIFDVILDKALQLCHAKLGIVFLYEDGYFEAVGMRGLPDDYRDFLTEKGRFEASPMSGLGRIVNRQQLVHVEDVRTDEAYLKGDPLRLATTDLGGARTFLAVPLIVQQKVLGAFSVYRQEVRKFSDSEIELAEIFARNAAIAVEHTKLLVKVCHQTEELEQLNRGLQSRVSEQVAELERLGRLKRFLSPDVAELIVSSGDDSFLRSHRRIVASVFCDLRGFTAFSESVEPEEAMEALQEYHRDMGKIIARYGGTIDHRAGDGIMVVLNDPLPVDEPAAQAVRMALDMRDHMRGLTERWQKYGHELGFGVGISYGYATLGLVGDDTRSDYTANGTVINLAARLCDDAKADQILITQRTFSEIEDKFDLEPLGKREYKGVGRPQNIYNVKAGIG